MPDILSDIWEQDDKSKELIKHWMTTKTIKDELLEKIKSNLKQNVEFTKEFSDIEIDRFIHTIVRRQTVDVLKKQIIEKYPEKFEELKEEIDQRELIRDFIFNNILTEEIDTIMKARHMDAMFTRKRSFLNLLLSSSDKEFRSKVSETAIMELQKYSKGKNHLLILSAKHGDKRLFNTLLEAKANPEAIAIQNKDGVTPLH